MKYYKSPRWTQEILDCSMPMTFDTYNKCSYNCLYCFSYYQKSHRTTIATKDKPKKDYQKEQLEYVSFDIIKRLFTLDKKIGSAYKQFFPFIMDRKVMQWGGLADEFDEYERKNGITLKLLEFFKSINYPISFSTKATWFLKDKRYTDLIKGQKNWHFKISIINLDENVSKKIELGCPSPQERLEAIKELSKINIGGITLRLRPFIIGMTDVNEQYLELIKSAYKNGADSVSTEFFCLEMRADERLKKRYLDMSKALNFDIFNFYRQYSNTLGYLRLNRKIKLPFMTKMKNLCDELGMRFYVSDAHCKEFSNNGSCCGLSETFNYSRSQFTEALLLAKKKGIVKYSDIEEGINKYFQFKYLRAHGFNTSSSKNRAIRDNQSMKDYIREAWNNPNSQRSPYKYFGGILIPIGKDKNNNLIYKYNETKIKK